MNFLINLFKRSKKGDNFRTPGTVNKYNDQIAQLNTISPNQYDKINVNTINRTSKTESALTQTKANTIVPGSR
jgi:hypothetical protein